MLHPHLSRAEAVSGGMQGHAYAVDVDRLAIGDSADPGVGLEPGPEGQKTGGRGQVGLAPPDDVIPVRVGDHGS
jgi:hypothetical protein